MKCLLVVLVLLVHSCMSLTVQEESKFQARDSVNHNTGVKGSITIQSNDENTYLIRSNGVPDHAAGAFNGGMGSPNFIQANQNNWVVPKNPEIATEPGCLNMGPIGVAINGVPIYNPYTRTCCDAGSTELNLFDECWGHPSPGNTYHYHTAPLCLFKHICGVPSEIVGVAFDGFPIYGPNDEFGREMTPDDLDECNGKKDSKGNYRYHITGKFPYFLGCYKGKVISQNSIRQNCQCTEPQNPCRENLGGNNMQSSSNTDSNELLGLSSDGHFKCCPRDALCDHKTNLNTKIPTANQSIAVGQSGMMGRRPRPGMGGQGGMTGPGGMAGSNMGGPGNIGGPGGMGPPRPGMGGPIVGWQGGPGMSGNMGGGQGGSRPEMDGPGMGRPRPGMGGPGGPRPFGRRPPMGRRQGFRPGPFGMRPRPVFGQAPGQFGGPQSGPIGQQSSGQNDQNGPSSQQSSDQQSDDQDQTMQSQFSKLMQMIQNLLKSMQNN